MIIFSKTGVLGFRGVDNLHKKFWNDILKIVDFFLMSNFWWSFLSFLILLKTKKYHQKLDIIKKSAIFKISSLNFLCKLSTPKNPSTSILEQKLGHYLILCSFFFIIFRLVSNFGNQSLDKFGRTFISRFYLFDYFFVPFFKWGNFSVKKID